eukprot:3428925-Rhodomonas_salina.3
MRGSRGPEGVVLTLHHVTSRCGTNITSRDPAGGVRAGVRDLRHLEAPRPLHHRRRHDEGQEGYSWTRNAVLSGGSDAGDGRAGGRTAHPLLRGPGTVLGVKADG